MIELDDENLRRGIHRLRPSRAAVVSVAVAALASMVAMTEAKARPDSLPFELAVVLRGCADAPFGADRLALELEAEIARQPLAPTAGAAAPRVWFHAPRCGDADTRVRVSLETVGARGPREVLAIALSGATPEDRSVQLAHEAHAALARIWSGVLAAAAGNPYVVALPIALDGNPYRSAMMPSRPGLEAELGPRNPYRN